jgi:hypothetical protein
MNQENFIRRYFIVGERRLSNYWWATVICLGSFGFLFTGLSSYFQTFFSSSGEVTQNSPFFDFLFGIFHFGNGPLPFLQNKANDIHFFPQGLLMCFYSGFFRHLKVF